MAKKMAVKVVLNGKGVRDLLKSGEMMSVCTEQASRIMNRCGDGYEMSTHVGKNRVNVSVSAGTYEAIRDNMRNNTLLKAVRG